MVHRLWHKASTGWSFAASQPKQTQLVFNLDLNIQLSFHNTLNHTLQSYLKRSAHGLNGQASRGLGYTDRNWIRVRKDPGYACAEK